MDLISFIPGIGPVAAFTPGANTPAPFNVSHTGATDGSGPSTATVNQAELYNRLLLQVASVIAGSGLTIDNANWAQLLAAVQKIAHDAAAGTYVTVANYMSDFAVHKVANGYAYLGPLGMLLQWGTFTNPGGGSFLNVPLPINYTGTPFAGVATTADASAITATETVTSSYIRVQNGGGVGFFLTIGSMF